MGTTCSSLCHEGQKVEAAQGMKLEWDERPWQARALKPEIVFFFRMEHITLFLNFL